MKRNSMTPTPHLIVPLDNSHPNPGKFGHSYLRWIRSSSLLCSSFSRRRSRSERVRLFGTTKRRPDEGFPLLRRRASSSHRNARGSEKPSSAEKGSSTTLFLFFGSCSSSIYFCIDEGDENLHVRKKLSNFKFFKNLKFTSTRRRKQGGSELEKKLRSRGK